MPFHKTDKDMEDSDKMVPEEIPGEDWQMTFHASSVLAGSDGYSSHCHRDDEKGRLMVNSMMTSILQLL